MQWSSTHTDADSVVEAATELASGIEAGLGGEAAHLVVLFVAPEWHPALASLLGELRRRLGEVAVVGCSGAGLAADEQLRRHLVHGTFLAFLINLPQGQTPPCRHL